MPSSATSTLAGARFRGVDLRGVVTRDVALCDVDIHGEIWHLTINGVPSEPVEGPSWPESRSYPVRECLL